MSKIAMFIIGAVVAVAAVGGYILMNKKDNKAENRANNNSQNQSNQNQNANKLSDEESTEGSLESFRSAGKARSCTFAYSGEEGSGDGRMYTDGKGRGFMTMDLKTSRGNTGQQNILVLSEKTYGWTKTDGGSNGIIFDTKTIQTNNTSSPTTSNTQSAGKSFSMKCKSWDVDEQMLSVPTDVNFISIPLSP